MLSINGIVNPAGFERYQVEWGIGDNPNDFSMLEWCGRSFAMADGHPDGPKYAKGVAGPCEEDGVAIIIEVIPLNTYTVEALFDQPMIVPIGIEMMNAKNTERTM